MNKVLLSWSIAVRDRLRGRYADRGAGFVEYAGLLLLIAAVVGAVFSLGLHTRIGEAIERAVSSVIDRE